MQYLGHLESRLAIANQSIQDHAHEYGRIYSWIASALFLVGIAASTWFLDIAGSQINVTWGLLNLCIGAPVAICLNAIGLKISATILDAHLSFNTALKTCSVAICANLLPVPAGTILQTSVLASRGSSLLRSGLIVITGNIVIVATIISLVGVALCSRMLTLGSLMFTVGVAFLIVCWIVIVNKSSAKLASAFIVLRFARTLVIVLRLQLSFMSIGVTIDILDVALFSGAVVMGTALAIFPAGLGASESIAALIALIVGIAPAAAFLATALNRLLTLAFASVIFVSLKLAKRGLIDDDLQD